MKKLTKTQQNFLLDKMAEGLTVKDVCEKYSSSLPLEKDIWKFALVNEEFAAVLDKAHTIMYYRLQDEYNYISKKLASELFPDTDFREAEAMLKRRADALKYLLKEIAPRMAKKFDKAQKIEVSGESIGPKIQILNYYKKDDKTISSAAGTSFHCVEPSFTPLRGASELCNETLDIELLDK